MYTRHRGRSIEMKKGKDKLISACVVASAAGQRTLEVISGSFTSQICCVWL